MFLTDLASVAFCWRDAGSDVIGYLRSRNAMVLAGCSKGKSTVEPNSPKLQAWSYPSRDSPTYSMAHLRSMCLLDLPSSDHLLLPPFSVSVALTVLTLSVASPSAVLSDHAPLPMICINN